MASLAGRAALALALASPLAAAPALRAEVAPPWSVAARSFALAPGSVDPDSGDAIAGRAFDGSAWTRGGLGLDVDGEFWRVGAGRATASAVLVDAAIGVRALDSGAFRLELLGGARMDASVLAGAEEAAARADAAPMAAARATLGIGRGSALTLRAGVAPDAEADPSWRLSGTLRLGLDDGWSFVLDARWSAAAPSALTGADADGLGRASLWAGFALPF